MTEVRRGYFVELLADVTAPAASVFEPGCEGVDVGAAAFAADDTGGSGLDYGNGGLCFGGGGGRGRGGEGS